MANVESLKRDDEPRLELQLPFGGSVPLPPARELAYYTGLGALVALELVEWPAALALAVAHRLATRPRGHAGQ